jgi:hypothetical protein
MTKSVVTWTCVGFALCLAIYPGLTGCRKDGVIHELVGWVEGTVTDSLTRYPIDGAAIRDTADTLATPRAWTDSQGHYKLAASPGSRFSLYCSKEGYVTKKSAELYVRKHETITMDFELVLLGTE